MTRLFPISDLHGNFVDVPRHLDSSPFTPKRIREMFTDVFGYKGSDTVVFACGDIGERMQGLMWCERLLAEFPYLNVCYCPGNHEFYGGNMDLILHDLHIADETHPRLHVLDGVYKVSTVIKDSFGDPILTVVGGTLWTDFCNQSAEVMNIAQREMNDYRCIMAGGENKRVTPNRILNFHYEIRKGMFRMFEKANRSLPLVAMSHHTPYIGIPKDGLHYCFHVNLQEQFENCSHLPTYWFSGHTHVSEVHKEEFSNGQVQFISNQVGYPNQLSTGFSLNCVLEV